MAALILICLFGCQERTTQPQDFVDDRADLMTAGERARIEAYHRQLLEDLDIHLQVIILEQTAADIDALAVRLFEDYGLGKTTLAARGVLLLVDPQGQQVRLEIGYDMEPIFTDILVSQIERDQMAPFFQMGRVGPGLEATVELLVSEALRQPGESGAGKSRLEHLSGGGGARTRVEIGSGSPVKSPTAKLGRFAPGADPLATLRVYQKVLRERVKDPELEIYTPGTRDFFRKWLITDAQQANEFNSLSEVLGRGEVRSIDDYAVVRASQGTQSRTPYFLRRSEKGWQLDFVTMSQVIGFNHLNQWHFRTQNHPYMFAFDDWTFDRHGFPKKQ